MGNGFQRNIAISTNSPIIRVVKQRSHSWTIERRLTVASANDNKGKWWTCIARTSVADLERRFLEGSVGRVLYDAVGGILGDHRQLKHTGRKHYLYLQLTANDWRVEMCLSEIGIVPIAEIPYEQIRYY